MLFDLRIEINKRHTDASNVGSILETLSRSEFHPLSSSSRALFESSDMLSSPWCKELNSRRSGIWV
jgi:hypothetical protein